MHLNSWGILSLKTVVSSIFMPPDVVDNVTMWEKWKTSDCSYTQHFSTSESTLKKRLSLLHYTKPIWSCSSLVCLNSAENRRYVSSKANKRKLPRFSLQPILVKSSTTMYSPTKVSTYPPSLTRKGSLHHGNKSEILDCIVPADLDNQRPVTTPAVLDGAVLIQMLRPGSAVTIRDYYTDVFAPYNLSWFERNNWVDIAWDIYSKASLKSGVR